MAQLDTREKLAILADAAKKYDASCASSGTSKRDSRGGTGVGSTEGMGICHAYAAMLREGPMIDALRVTLATEDDSEGWRDAARGLAEAGFPANAIVWQVEGGEADLFGATDPAPSLDGPSFAVPRSFVDLARSAICHSDPERFALLYAMLLKL